MVLGSGGHTGEMIALLSALPPTRYSPVTLVVAATDKLSQQRAVDLLLADGKPWADVKCVTPCPAAAVAAPGTTVTPVPICISPACAPLPRFACPAE